MKEGYWFFGALIFFQFGKLLYQYYQKKSSDKAVEEIADLSYNRYLELRDEAFALKPKDLAIVVANDKETAFALIMEIHDTSILQTVAAFSDGEVWAFNSNNARKNISDRNSAGLSVAAIEAVAAAQYHFARMRRGDTEGLSAGYIKFHVKTNYDTYSVGNTIAKMLNQSSEWSELVTKSTTVINEFNTAAKSHSGKHIYFKSTIKRSKPANF